MGYSRVTVKPQCIIDARDLQSNSKASHVGLEGEDLSHELLGMGASSSKQVGRCDVAQLALQGGNQSACLIGLARTKQYHLKPSETPSE